MTYDTMTKRNADDLLVSPTCTQDISKKMNKKSTPTKDEGMSEWDKDAMNQIKNSAPAWFVKAFTYLTGELSDIKNKLNDNIGEVKKDRS